MFSMQRATALSYTHTKLETCDCTLLGLHYNVHQCDGSTFRKVISAKHQNTKIQKAETGKHKFNIIKLEL